MNWDDVGKQITGLIEEAEAKLAESKFNEGQIRSLRALAGRLPRHGVILADEVGMGKTRIAAAIAHAVILAGGRVAFLVPPGLGAQWVKELRAVGVKDVPDILRSIGGYLDGWDGHGPVPWFSRKAVMISHAFANWRLGQNAQPWRWALLPLSWSAWRQGNGHRRLWGSQGLIEQCGDRRAALENAATAIASATKRQVGCAAHSKLRQHVFDNFDGSEACNPVSYAQQNSYRLRLEQIVGVGLGSFDLVIIDEAHKARHEDSGLSRLLENIIVPSNSARRLALTATPVELDVEQWTGMLVRVSVQDHQNAIRDVCREYAEALEAVRGTWRTSADNRRLFFAAARKFQDAMCPFVLRRDKREDEPIKSFLQMEGEGVDTYRRETPIEIRPQDLSPQWLDAVIAAEALSAIKDMEGGRFQQDKRLRLTIGNGHGISVVMDAAVEEEVVPNVEGASVIPIAIENSRVLYWREVLRSAVRASAHHDRARTETSLLYEHPSIVTAVDAIEKITAEGRKVLVFGRFTRPMKALEEILNARAMLRHLAEERDWPQSTIAQGDEVAVDAALAQMPLDSRWSRADVSKLLGERYSSYETRRKALLDRVHRVIDREISGLAPRSRTVLAGAVLDILETGGFEVGDDDIAEAARRIVESLCDDDTVLNGYGVNEQEHDDVQDGRLQGKIDERIQEEYGIPRGGYARRLYGETKPHTRRNLQLKFNRANCFPYVLIAQSQVGREGLNLHEQCRDVVLLHPEWNPGVVEQQIGRVDRLGSRWCKDFDVWKEAGAVGEPPRIEIRPIMFMGTYDEHNWSVLKRRWELLRGQLHGIVVSGADMMESGDADKEIAAELNDQAPRLSPR